MKSLDLYSLITIFSVGVFNSTIILIFSKDQFKESIIATIRSLLQLMALGIVLEKIFLLNTWLLKSLAVVFIVSVGSATIKKKINSNFSKYHFIFFSMFTSLIPPLIISYIILDDYFFSKPSFFIPFVGMLVGNSLTGLNLGLRGFFKELKENKENIITFLSFGASTNEAISDIITNSMRNALTPIINTMLVVGLVSIPGLMTGQMMAGVNPFLSARYQYFLIIMIQSTVLLAIFLYFFLLSKKLKAKNNLLLQYIGEEDA